MGGKKPLRRPLWPPTRATASNYYPLGLDGAGGAAKPLLRAPKKPAPLHGRLPAFSGAVDAFERARKCFLEWRYFFSIILSEFLKNRVALHRRPKPFSIHKKYSTVRMLFQEKTTEFQRKSSGFPAPTGRKGKPPPGKNPGGGEHHRRAGVPEPQERAGLSRRFWCIFSCTCRKRRCGQQGETQH